MLEGIEGRRRRGRQRMKWPMGNVLLADGELYTGTVSSFQGSDPTISRSQSLRPIKTETSLNWLQGEILPLPIEWAVPRPQGGGPVPPAGPESRVSPVWDLWADGAPHRPPTDPAFMASAYIPESLGSSEGDDDIFTFRWSWKYSRAWTLGSVPGCFQRFPLSLLHSSVLSGGH